MSHLPSVSSSSSFSLFDGAGLQLRVSEASVEGLQSLHSPFMTGGASQHESLMTGKGHEYWDRCVKMC